MHQVQLADKLFEAAEHRARSAGFASVDDYVADVLSHNLVEGDLNPPTDAPASAHEYRIQIKSPALKSPEDRIRAMDAFAIANVDAPVLQDTAFDREGLYDERA